MSEHPIQGLMTTAMENLKEMIDVNTIIGDPVETPDGSIILSVSKVGFGFAAGGSEFYSDRQSQYGGTSPSHPFGGGSGGGVSITPIAFLIVGKTGVRMVPLNDSVHLYDKLIDLAPQVVEKIQNLLNGKNDNHSNNYSKKEERYDNEPPI
ncbi:GerW family sporulation protein [Bacillus tianshenii]|nr:GerW family sporulation protein [Bacillus tianshenii]